MTKCFLNIILSEKWASLLFICEKCRLGKTGWFNGYQTLNNPLHITNLENSDQAVTNKKLIKMFHWEVFSNENLTGQTPIDEDTSSDLLLNAKEITQKLKKAGALSLGVFKMLEDDGMITNKELYEYCQNPQVKLTLSDFTIKCLSEWSDKVDWASAYDKAIGFNKHGQKVTINQTRIFQDSNRYIEAFRTPHAWFNDRMVEAMKAQKHNLFDKGTAFFYHPVRFLKWLLDKDWV